VILTSSDLEKSKLIKKAALPMHTCQPNLEDVSLLMETADSSSLGIDSICLQDAACPFNCATVTDALGLGIFATCGLVVGMETLRPK